MTHAHNPKGEWTNQHLMGVNGKFAGISRDDLIIVADRFGIGAASKILKQVADAVSAWPDYAAEAGVDTPTIERIRKDHVMLSS